VKESVTRKSHRVMPLGTAELDRSSVLHSVCSCLTAQYCKFTGEHRAAAHCAKLILGLLGEGRPKLSEKKKSVVPGRNSRTRGGAEWKRVMQALRSY